MRRAIASACLAALALTACATAPVYTTLSTPFTAADMAWSQAKGVNTISGSALMRTVGGDVKTCAGFEVELAPDSAYTRERMSLLFGGLASGSMGRGNSVVISGTPPEFYSYVRKAYCDATGSFSFTDLPDGTYYAMTRVHWDVPSSNGFSVYMMPQGAWMMQRVTVAGGQSPKIVLTQ